MCKNNFFFVCFLFTPDRAVKWIRIPRYYFRVVYIEFSEKSDQEKFWEKIGFLSKKLSTIF